MPYTRLFFHVVWNTLQRQPTLSDDNVRNRTYSVIVAKAAELGAIVHAIGGVADHVHLVVSIPPAIAIAKFIGQVKGVSSHFISHVWPETLGHFQWQEGYAAFTVSESNLPAVVSYVQQQAEHHADRSTNGVCRGASDVDDLLDQKMNRHTPSPA
jgi:putative transposase